MARVFQKPGGPTVAGRKPWYIDWVDAGGKRHKARTDAQTKAEAEAILRAKLSLNAKCEILGTTDPALVKPVLFSEFFEKEYLTVQKTRVRSGTYDRAVGLGKHVLPVFGSMTLRAINAGHVEGYMRKRAGAEPTPAPATINRERSLLSAVLNTAFRRGLIDVNPVGRVRPLREDNARDRWLTEAEVGAIVEKGLSWIRPFVIFAVNTGLRIGEICALRWQDLDSNPGFIRVGVESKSHKPRYIPINSAAKEILESQTRHVGPKGAVPWVFCNSKFLEAYRPNSVYHDFKAAVRAVAAELRENGKETDLEEVTFHTTRHTFASWLIQKGVPIAEVQQYLGHFSDAMTRRYAHLAPATGRRNALEILVPKEGPNPVPNVEPERRAL